MFLVPIHVPVFVDGEKKYLSTEWHRSTCLLRDSFKGRFGPIVLAAPSSPVEFAKSQRLEPVTGDQGIELVAGFDENIRCRQYWMKHHAQWVRTLTPLVERAQVVHGTMDDVYRPIAFTGVRLAQRMKKFTVFVQDTDIVLQNQQLGRTDSLGGRIRRSAYNIAFEKCVRWAVKRADLSLLKGAALLARYGAIAKNAHDFQDTSHSRSDVVAWDKITPRLASLGSRPLRLVYCGRLERRKGPMESVELIRRVRDLGHRVEFDIIGDGTLREDIEKNCREWGIADRVRLLGRMNYGPELIAKLAEYDGLLFTPTAEDTPRMIFDGYAGSLPLVAFDIDYVRQCAAVDRAAVLLPRNDAAESAARIAALALNPHSLRSLTEAAHAAAFSHSVENWYGRRAALTIEAYERHANTGAGQARPATEPLPLKTSTA